METINRNAGSCRDHASLFVAIARTLRLASRFVSRYLHTPTNGIFFESYRVPVANAMIAESINPIQGTFRRLGRDNSTLTIPVSIRQSDPPTPLSRQTPIHS